MLLDLLAPPLCWTCGEPAARRSALCLACRGLLRFLGDRPVRLAGVRVWAAVAYEGPARDLVRALKFRGAARVGEAMASLVVANACFSALTSTTTARGHRARDLRAETALLPALADEFFHRGVRNYIGTAWQVSDDGAVEFARRFYDELIPARDSGEAGKSVGEALKAAREALAAQRRYGALWAAYQHYGDPSHVPVPARPNAG